MSSTPSQVQRVILTGFMGSGKTTVGRLLSARIGWRFVDLDDEITGRSGLAVPEIFARFGEAHFRREETSALASVLMRGNLVLALGGGAVEAEANRLLLRQAAATAVVHLSGTFDALRARCLTQATEPGAVARPILADIEEARDRFTRRAPSYTELAAVTLDTASRTPQSLAEEIADSLEIAKLDGETA